MLIVWTDREKNIRNMEFSPYRTREQTEAYATDQFPGAHVWLYEVRCVQGPQEIKGFYPDTYFLQDEGEEDEQ